MNRFCPNCQRLVYSRHIRECGCCGTKLPENLFSEDYEPPPIPPPKKQPPRFDPDAPLAMEYTRHFRKLSLPARFAVALHCFERYCRLKGLQHPLIDEFLGHGWKYPLAHQLMNWDSDRGQLFKAGLGEKPLAEEITVQLASLNISKEEFSELLNHTVEVVYSSFFRACNDAVSLWDLDKVFSIVSQAGVSPPPVEPFSMSLWCDNHGWGKRPTVGECEEWRYKALGNFAV